MKKGIHPDYHEVVATCVCGGEFKIGSTQKEVRVDICSACHPIFTGGADRKILDAEGLVDKFKRRYAGTADLQAEIAQRKERRVQIAIEEAERKTRKQERVGTKPKA